MIEDVTRLFVVRHGETAWNVDTRIQGQLDVPLNDTGRWQAARLAEALAGEGIAAIYSSDLQRASETAAALAVRGPTRPANPIDCPRLSRCFLLRGAGKTICLSGLRMHMVSGRSGCCCGRT